MNYDHEIEAAISRMLSAYSDNEWFLRQHWPMNAPRIRRIARDLLRRFPERQAKILDVGCFNGYLSQLAAEFGFQVTACDAHCLPEVERLSLHHRIGFFKTNLNEHPSFPSCADSSFDAVIMGEIIEHVLNCPLGLLKEVRRVLRPAGVLLLSTPNPSNVMNASRMLLDRYVLWGTDKFASLPKIDGTGVTCEADIHYREYRRSELAQMIMESGLQILSMQYVGFGEAHGESRLKTLIKRSHALSKLTTQRLFASTHYVLAQKVQEASTC
jgi:2-polyprenyl-3-methyl-5-hydroxy-6-metoxy-1,4-benzoquinol methylase